jgi:ABC-type branched-subunit amino acid transport system substrate-binding protein
MRVQGLANVKLLGLGLSLALAGCTSGKPEYAYVPPPTPISRPTPAPALRPMLGTRLALLAPITGPNAERGTALVQAVRLALDAPSAPPLDVIDTHGTPDGAASAAAQAIAQGAGLILGPLTAPETAAAATAAASGAVPILAFTSDETQAKPGVWVLGLTPSQQVRRLVLAATSQSKTHFAALLPNSEYGRVIGDALRANVTTSTPDIRSVDDSNIKAADATVKDISGYATRRGPIDAKLREAINKHNAEGRKEAAELRRSEIPPPPFDALLLASTGEGLDVVTSLLPYYDIDPPAVRVMGPALWANPAARGTGNLTGAWYAAPDPSARSDFNTRYTAKFGTPAPGLADLAYDAASIARVLAANGGFSVAGLTRPEGYAGVDGVLGLLPDGHVRRGLALFEIQRGGPQMIEPAPDTLAAPGL